MNPELSTIEAVETKLIEAYLTADIATISSLYHEDLIFNTPDGRTISGQEDIESIRQGFLTIRDYKPSNQLVKIIGDTVVISMIIRFNAVIGGQPLNTTLKFLRVWKLLGKEFKVIAISGYQVAE